MQTVERNELFDLAYRFVTETSENIFLTGKAGTGKTTFLKYLKVNSTKNIIIAAPTGVAAINAGGVTLHSLFQLPFHPFLPTKINSNDLLAKIRFNKQRQQLIRKMELLVIDEVSMVRCDVMDAIDVILKSIRRNHHLPFGGVQLLLIGDLFQLPPVAQNAEWKILSEYYPSPFFFDSIAIKEQMPLLIELDKIYRQKEEGFVQLLNKVRNNNMQAEDFEELHLRYRPDFKLNDDENYITLTSHNNQADLINQQQIQKIPAAAFIYKAIIENEFSENLFPAESELILKEGAQVMFLKNDIINKRYYNGKIGRVKSLEKDKVIVEADGTEIEVPLVTWENTRYTLDRLTGKLEQETIGRFTQFPLRLAWAITIHKSQGLTFDNVLIDAGAAFSSGQVYVALSRCTSLNGIILLSKIPSSAIYSNENVVIGHRSLTPKDSLADRFTGARQAFTQQVFEDLFSFNSIVSFVGLLEFHITQQQNKLNNGTIAWIENFKQRIQADQLVGLKFIGVITSLLKTEGVIEKNALLQNRISDAANHFLPKIDGYLTAVLNHPLLTEHKETADVINEHLLQVAESVYSTQYLLQYCKKPFSITAFLQHKLKFAQTKLSISCYASGKKQAIADTLHPELYDTLKRWRDMICEETGAPIYMVANLTSLKEICTFLPLTKKDLQLLSGFGKAKAEKYGDEIIEAVESYCSRLNIETNMSAKEAGPKKLPKEKNAQTKTDTKKSSLILFKQGKSIIEIAKERNLAASTIESHLSYFIGKGEIEIDALVSKEKQQLIMEASARLGSVGHKIVKDYLPGEITYGEIRMVLSIEKHPL